MTKKKSQKYRFKPIERLFRVGAHEGLKCGSEAGRKEVGGTSAWGEQVIVPGANLPSIMEPCTGAQHPGAKTFGGIRFEPADVRAVFQNRQSHRGLPQPKERPGL